MPVADRLFSASCCIFFCWHHSMLLYVWDISGEQPLLVKKWKPHSLPTLELSFEESEGALLLTASADATVKVWDVARGYLTHFLRGHSSVVTAATFLCVEDRVCVVSASDDNVIKVWDLKEGLVSHVPCPCPLFFPSLLYFSVTHLGLDFWCATHRGAMYRNASRRTHGHHHHPACALCLSAAVHCWS